MTCKHVEQQARGNAVRSVPRRNRFAYGGQCLSFLSFHLLPGTTKTLTLTAQYRNHYYVEKLLGNLIGLGRLMAFIAKETDLNMGALTVISTRAEIDLPDATRKDFTKLLDDCTQAQLPAQAAA